MRSWWRQNLRARDRAELFATEWSDDPAVLAEHAANSGAFRWGCYLDGRPVAMIGAAPRWPGVWTAWAWGTDDWPRVVLTLTRHVRRFMLPALLRAGAHRVDAWALAEHEDARRWLERCGAKPVNHLVGWGRNRETFVVHVWTRHGAKRAVLGADWKE